MAQGAETLVSTSFTAPIRSRPTQGPPLGAYETLVFAVDTIFLRGLGSPAGWGR